MRKLNLMLGAAALLLLPSPFFHLHGQTPYNQSPEMLKANSVWAFYKNGGLNFNDRSNFYFNTEVGNSNQSEGCASIADPKTGELLFYSNGLRSYNRNHVVMPNGDNLKGNGSNTNGHFSLSTTQGVVITSVPNESDKYYLFSLESASVGEELIRNSLYYSVVDMTLDSGRGDIDPNQKNIVLDSTFLGESMMAVPGDNCDDAWLLVHTMDSAVFKAYYITPAGIDPKPVLSYTGNQISGVAAGDFYSLATYKTGAYTQGSMAISPDRTKLALTTQNAISIGLFPFISQTGPRTSGTLLCDFDPATGVVSNALLVDTLSGYGIAFSPDNSKLYVSTMTTAGAIPIIAQFDITSGNAATITNSREEIGAIGSSAFPAFLKLYNDTIYVANPDLTIDRINHPNLSGTAAGYESNAIYVSNGITALPQEAVIVLGKDTTHTLAMDTLICSGWTNGQQLTPMLMSPDDSYYWNDGTTDSLLSIDTAGTYWVTYGNDCHWRVDTFIVKGSNIDVHISIDKFDLSTAGVSYVTYQWLLDGAAIPGATNSVYTVTQNGDYQVVVSNETGCIDTSDVYKITNYTGIEGLNQLSRQVSIHPNPTTDKVYITAPVAVDVVVSSLDGRTLLQTRDADVISLGHMASGVYFLRITDADGQLIKVEKVVKE